MGDISVVPGTRVAAPGETASRQQWPEHWRKTRALYKRYGALTGYGLAALLVWLGWAGRHERNINAEYGLGYALGVAGGTLMLLLLMYTLRKRLRWFAWAGSMRHWFRGHMMLGVTGPVLILYHCNFELGDLNSKVALFCTLLVAASGLVGRYLYSGFHNGLYGSKATLRELARTLQSPRASGQASILTASLREELAAFDQRVLTPPASLAESLLRPWVIGWQTRRAGSRMVRAARHELRLRSATSATVGQHAGRLEATMRRYLHEHLAQVRQLARLDAFERLFAYWHVVHVPFFFMMVFSALFHVFAVHLY